MQQVELFFPPKRRLTHFPVLRAITAAVVEIPQATVSSQSVHDPRCTDSVHERSLSCRCQRKQIYQINFNIYLLYFHNY